MKALLLGTVTVASMMSLFAISANTALASELALCKSLVEAGKLCPEGEVWEAGTKILALAENPELKNSLATVKCEDSKAVAETTTTSGEKLGIKLTSLEFGKLPTPKLGEGCAVCTGGIHPTLPITGAIEVSGEDDFFLTASGSIQLLNCFGLGITCVYGAENLKALIDPDSGKHKEALEEKALGVVLINTTVSRKEGSNGFCPATGAWTANYTIYTLESGGKAVQGWLGLYVTP